MNKLINNIALSAVLATAVISSTPFFAYADETKEQRDERMAWWREARLGMFVHWGLYSQAAGVWDGKKYWGGVEWIQSTAGIPADEYEAALKPLFKPKEGFAEEWAQLAKDMGAKYVVFTSKHHEGFALHDSAVTDYDAMDFCGRDLMREIVNAIRQKDLKVGIYHSMIDWHHPDYVAFDNSLPHPLKHPRNQDKPLPVEGHDFNRYLDFLSTQVEELTTHYGPLDILWWDFSHKSAEGHHWRAKSLMEQVRKSNPMIIQNNRLYFSENVSGDNLSIFNPSKGDFTTPEQHIPATGMPGVDWEVCMTLNGTWGYSKHDLGWKSSETIIRNTIDIVSKGGNYLLNVGPAPDGSIPEATYVRFHELGNWMKKYGSSIYGTTANPLKKVNWGRITAKEKRLYLHVFDWPQDDTLIVPMTPDGKVDAWMMADPSMKHLETQVTPRGLEIKINSEFQNPYASVIVLQGTGKTTVDFFEGNTDFELYVGAADFKGGLSVEKKADNRDNIGSWLNTSDSVSWTFKLKNGGNFEIHSEVAALQDSNLKISADKNTLNTAIKATGSYEKFLPVTLGSINLPDDVTVTLTLQPGENWSPVNLRNLKLVPKNK